MLNQVPIQIQRSARQVTLRHPNAMDCTVWRKVINRVSADTPATIGGLPTIGGLGVLDSEDEADFDWQPKGDAKIVMAGVFQAEGGNTVDTDNGLLYPAPPIEALIECILDPGDPDFFMADKPDMVTVEPGGGVVLTYEVTGVQGNVNIPPYTRRYILAPRSDMNVGM